MKKKPILSLLIFATLLLFSVSCSSDDPEQENEEELITTLNLTFTNVADANDVVTASSRDLDGVGGNPAQVTNPALTQGVTYTVTVEFLNESETPVEDITEEVEEEAEEHQVFFTAGGNLTMTHTYGDMDSDNNPIGLTNTIAIDANSGSGTLQVALIHEPDKAASGVSSGNIANAGGETDIEVTFTVTVN